MRLPGRISAAIEILTDMEENHRPASIALKNWGLSHRFAGSGDRGVIGNLVYDSLRNKASLAFVMGEETPRALVLATIVRLWGEDVKTLNESFENDDFAPTKIDEKEIELLQSSSEISDEAKANFPLWLKDTLAQSFGENLVSEGEAMAKRPSLDLRINALKSKLERVKKDFKKFDIQSVDLLPNSLRIEAGESFDRVPNVTASEAYKKGWFEVQDLGSQIVAALIGAKPGEQILDYCAGAGGKTLSIAAQMQNKGQIFAHDSDKHRLAPIYDRLKRNGVRNVQTIAPEEEKLEKLHNKMDRVVVDAPCTGTGTWRRRPDTKWRLNEDQLNDRVKQQAEILREAAKFVRVGGQLTYITCSILPQENSEQIAAFIKDNPSFSVLPAHSIWQKRFGSASSARPYFDDNGLTLTPASCGTDGFYISILQRETLT